MKILWCITGAGHLLAESAEKIRELAGKHQVTLAFSAAGYEVARMYGLLKELEDAAYEVIREEEQGASSAMVGRLAKKEYYAVIVSPCTANTVAKTVYGIADSLVSNIIAQSVKSKTPACLVPTDSEKTQETVVPMMLDPKACRDCGNCPPIDACPKDAFYRGDRVRIDLLKCDACRLCIKECPYSALSFGARVRINMRDVDIENTKKLGRIEGISVLYGPDKIELK